MSSLSRAFNTLVVLGFCFFSLSLPLSLFLSLPPSLPREGTVNLMLLQICLLVGNCLIRAYNYVLAVKQGLALGLGPNGYKAAILE